MFEVRETDEYKTWFSKLRGTTAKARIDIRIRRLSLGNLGDAKFFEGIGELRIDYGPGYRLYFIRRAETVIVLLCGGNKSTQSKDIALAKSLASKWKPG